MRVMEGGGASTQCHRGTVIVDTDKAYFTIACCRSLAMDYYKYLLNRTHSYIILYRDDLVSSASKPSI